MVCMFCLALDSVSLLRFGGGGSFYTQFFTLAFWRSWLLPNGLFCFKRYISTPSIFACSSFSDVTNLENPSRAILGVLLEGYEKFWWTCGCFPCDLIWESVPIFCHGISIFRIASPIWSPFACDALLGSSCYHCFPGLKGLQTSLWDRSAPLSNFLGSLPPAFLFCLSVTKKVSMGSYLCSPTG